MTRPTPPPPPAPPPTQPLPEGKRPPFGWAVFPVARDAEAALSLPAAVPPGRPSRLRLTCGLDSREPLRVEARVADGAVAGALDLRFPFVHQPFDLRLDAGQTAAAQRHGLRLRLSAGEGPAWFFAAGGSPDRVAPHLIGEPAAAATSSADRVASVRGWLRSPASLQQFGWRLGCVLDGLIDLGDAATARSHLGMFFDGDGRLLYEDPHSRPIHDAVYGVEATLPFAHVATWRPEHPSLDRCIDYWLASRHEDGNVGGRFVSAEGSYTVAYPMAVIGVQRGREDLIDLALRQLRIRRERLRDGGAIWLRDHGDGRRTFRNWARGAAWYLLGLTRTLVAIDGVDRPGVAELRDELPTAARAVLAHQRGSGLWANFLDDASTAIDTSGSAGIAAALALAARHGLLDASHRAAAEAAHDALLAAVEPDGVLPGAAQDNRGGEELQRSDYRVIHPAGIGLLGQLIAALAPPAR